MSRTALIALAGALMWALIIGWELNKEPRAVNDYPVMPSDGSAPVLPKPIEIR